VAGYPNISVPVGINSEGMPAGVWMYGGRRSTSKLIRLGYDLEQEMQARTQPQFLGSVPPDPADAGICTTAAAPASTSTQRAAASLPARLLRNL
jgi:hypothetical protein